MSTEFKENPTDLRKFERDELKVEIINERLVNESNDTFVQDAANEGRWQERNQDAPNALKHVLDNHNTSKIESNDKLRHLVCPHCYYRFGVERD